MNTEKFLKHKTEGEKINIGATKVSLSASLLFMEELRNGKGRVNMQVNTLLKKVPDQEEFG